MRMKIVTLKNKLMRPLMLLAVDEPERSDYITSRGCPWSDCCTGAADVSNSWKNNDWWI